MSSQHLAPPPSSKLSSSPTSSSSLQHNPASTSSGSTHSHHHHHHHHHHHSGSNVTIPTASLVEPPALFSSVAPQIYRSATPTLSNHSFLRTLQLRTILSLTAELPSPSLTTFCKKHGIRFLHYGLKRWGSEDDYSALISSTSTPPVSVASNSIKDVPSGGQSNFPLDISFLHTFTSPHHPGSASSAPFFSTPVSSSSATLTEELVKDSLQILLTSSYHPILVTDTSGIHEIGVLLGCLRKLQRWNFATILLEYRHFAGNRARATNERFVEMFDTDLVTFPEQDLLPFWFKEQIKADEAELDRIEACP